MFDPILKKSIQRWEYEGGSVLQTLNGHNMEILERNKSFRSWEKTNRLPIEKTFETSISPLNRAKSTVNKWHEAS
jgi:hypothetical protein